MKYVLRYALTLAILIGVWLDSKICIGLSLTLLTISNELMVRHMFELNKRLEVTFKDIVECLSSIEEGCEEYKKFIER